MSDIHYYKTSVYWNEGRTGSISSEGKPGVQVATPPEFPKGVPGIWSPEDLLVAAVNTCVMTTFLAIADNSGLQFKSYSCDATGKLEKIDGKFMISEIEIAPKITVSNEKDVERANRIIIKSEQNCLISNSVKAKITLNPEVILEEAEVNL